MRTAWVVEATGDERAWLRGRLGTAADGVVARGWLEMGGLGCAGRCGRRGCNGVPGLGMSELGCADGCGWRGCKKMFGNGWGKEDPGMSELGCADG